MGGASHTGQPQYINMAYGIRCLTGATQSGSVPKQSVSSKQPEASQLLNKVGQISRNESCSIQSGMEAVSTKISYININKISYLSFASACSFKFL